MDELPKVACLFREKNRCWTLRRRVPDELRPLIGKGEIWQSYGDVTFAEARRLHTQEMANVEARFADARQRLVAGEVGPAAVEEAIQRGPIRSRSLKPLAVSTQPLFQPTEHVVRAAVLRWFHGEERKSEQEDREALSPDGAVSPDEVLDLRRIDHTHLSGQDGERFAEREVDGLLRQYGFGTPNDQLRRFAVTFLQEAFVEIVQRSRRRLGDHGGPVVLNPVFADVHALGAPPPPPERAMALVEAPLPAIEVLREWAAERNPSAATLTKYTRAFAHVADVLAFDDVRRITKKDVATFKQVRLEKVGLKTVKDEVLACGAVSKWAVTNDKLLSNPFEGLAPKATRRGQAPREGFNDEEAKLILIAARKESGWLRWAPWLMAFTGARVSEFAEMHRGHVRKEGETWIFDMVPTDQRAGKNSTFERMLPIHPAIIQEGFLAYVETLPKDPAGALFPDLLPDPRGGRVIPATSKMGRWMRGKVGVKDKRKVPNHAWRHRMEDELRKVRASAEVQDAITGRNNPRNAGAGYGKGYRGMPEETLEDLRKIKSPIPPLVGVIEPRETSNGPEGARKQ